MSSSLKYFILLKKKTGKKHDKSGSSSLVRPKSKTEVLPGTLLRLLDEVTKGKFYFILISLDSESVEIECVPGEIEEVFRDVLELLQSIPTCVDRLNVYNDKKWLSEGLTLKVGEPVFVKQKIDSSLLPGVIRYRGNLPDTKGIYFGVELLDHVGKGTTDGFVKGRRYFKCQKDGAVFLPISKIRKYKEGFEQSELLKAGGNHYASPHVDNSSCLSIGERVVWMTDNTSEHGTVKWVGTLPDSNDGSITVGVEFDNDIGSGTGKYNNQRLFYAKQNHASLIPIMGLIKEEVCRPVVDNFEKDSGLETVRSQEKDKQFTEKVNNFPFGSDIHRKLYNHNDFGTQSAYDGPGNSSVLNSDPWFTDRGVSSNTDDFTYDSSNHSANLLEKDDIRSNKRKIMSTSFNANMKNNDLKNTHVYNLGVNPVYEYHKKEDEEKENMKEKSKIVVDHDLSVGWRVTVPMKTPVYGVIRWIGEYDGKKMAGIETDEEMPGSTDGTFKGERYFVCAPKHAFFVPLHRCKKDKRFYTSGETNGFGSLETPDIVGNISPPVSLDVDKICGKNRGIQGHHNSCYLDSMLFSMFYFTTVFDSILYRAKQMCDMEPYVTVQKVIKEGIVNPLRRNNYVRADKVMRLRELLDKYSSITGMMNDEKDPEEFLVALLADVMKADPFLHLSSGESTYFYQLFLEKDDHLLLPTTQRLVEISCLQGNVKFKEVPSCLIIQMPRFGKDYKMYRRIIPSLELDISDILENSPRECNICGRLAEYECRECYQGSGAPSLNTTAFCGGCKERCHQHQSRKKHQQVAISVPQEYLDFIMQYSTKKTATSEPEYTVPREKMELFAVICIQTSHYVSFVKCGKGKKAPWVFFDSMADRKGEQSGYNIPQVTPVPDLTDWLSEEKFEQLAITSDDKQIPEHIRRLLGDAYMCMYQSTDVMRFK